MDVSPTPVDGLTASIRAAAMGYADHWIALAGDSLKALLFFGPAVTSRFDKRRHLADNVAVLAEVDLGLLRRLAPAGRKFGKRGIAAPIIMTPDYIHDSLDTFPLEMLDIQRRHVRLIGEDYFGALHLEPEHVRLQCERELKTLLIGMRQGLLAAAGHEKQLHGMEVAAVENLLRTLRGMLWLKGQSEPESPAELIAGVEQMLNRELAAVRAIVQGTGEKGWNQFVALYEDLEILRKKADAW